MKRAETIVFLLPTLLLAGRVPISSAEEGTSRGARTGALPTDPTPTSGQFKLTVDNVQFTRLPSSNAQEVAMRVTVRVGHQGATPTWWGRQTFVRLHNVQLTGSGRRPYRAQRLLRSLESAQRMGLADKKHQFYVTGLSGGTYDSKRQQYVVGCYLKGSGQIADFKATVMVPDP